MIENRRLSTIYSLVVGMTGIISLAFNKQIASYINIVIAFLLLFFSIILSLSYFLGKHYKESNNHLFVFSLSLLALSIFSFFTPERSFRIIVIIWALISIAKGINGINDGVSNLIIYKKHLFQLLMSIISFFMGIILLIEMNEKAVSHHVILLSFSMIADSLGALNYKKLR